MEENNNTAGAGTSQATEPTQGNEEKTFTQEELNAIVQRRIGEERAKYGDIEELRKKAAKLDEMEENSKTELQKATDKASKLEAELNKLKEAESIRSVRNAVAEKMGVPISLLSGNTEDECTEQAKALLAFAGKDSYPNVRDGGEVQTTGKKTTGQQFADWMKKSMK